MRVSGIIYILIELALMAINLPLAFQGHVLNIFAAGVCFGFAVFIFVIELKLARLRKQLEQLRG